MQNATYDRYICQSLTIVTDFLSNTNLARFI